MKNVSTAFLTKRWKPTPGIFGQAGAEVIKNREEISAVLL
jgi:hypothetical protein